MIVAVVVGSDGGGGRGGGHGSGGARSTPGFRFATNRVVVVVVVMVGHDGCSVSTIRSWLRGRRNFVRFDYFTFA